MKVNVAIPHYNSPSMLRGLLRQLCQEDFDQIVVLDDHSSPFKRPRGLEKEFPSVTFHYGEKNLGAGGNRNRALRLIDEGLVWFIDSDMQIISQANAAKLRAIFKRNPRQMVGGLIYKKSDVPMDWNYGHEMHPVHDAQFHELGMSLEAGDPTAWGRLKEHHWDYPWLQPRRHELTSRKVDWVAEGSFALPIELFREVGGYDQAFRYHEGQDLARRVRDTGASVEASAEFVTRHLEYHSHAKSRQAREKEVARELFFRKHWSMSRDVYDQLYEQ